MQSLFTTKRNDIIFFLLLYYIFNNVFCLVFAVRYCHNYHNDTVLILCKTHDNIFLVGTRKSLPWEEITRFLSQRMKRLSQDCQEI